MVARAKNGAPAWLLLTRALAEAPCARRGEELGVPTLPARSIRYSAALCFISTAICSASRAALERCSEPRERGGIPAPRARAAAAPPGVHSCVQPMALHCRDSHSSQLLKHTRLF